MRVCSALFALQGYYGGVLNTGSGALSVSNTIFTNNMASSGGQGGTVYSYDHVGATFTRCSWVNNTAYQGAAVYAATYGGEAKWTFTDCNFTGNAADQRGAAVWSSGTNFTFSGTAFSRNKALMGAGVYASSTFSELPLTMLFEDCALQGNAAKQSAGVASITGYANVTFSKCSISGNSAGQSAGGLYLQDTSARLTGCVLTRNSAHMAAALAAQGEKSTVQAVDTRFDSNKVCLQHAAACWQYCSRRRAGLVPSQTALL